MRLRCALFSVFSFYSFFVVATTFNPISIEKQVEEATGAAVVELVSAKPYRKDNGYIYTEYSFKIIENFNVSKSDLSGNELKIDMLGGKLDGVTSMIEGAPEFIKGKRIFVLLKKINTQIYLSNFTLGKYEIENVHGKDYLISDVFPMNAKIGRISKSKMINLMNEKWHLSESDNNIAPKRLDQYIKPEPVEPKISQNKNNTPERNIASVSDNNAFDSHVIFVVFLALLGIIVSLFILKDKK